MGQAKAVQGRGFKDELWRVRKTSHFFLFDCLEMDLHLTSGRFAALRARHTKL